MWMEIARLALGVMIMAFHRQIADHILVFEHFFATRLRARGLQVPLPPTQSTAHTIYFLLGTLVCVIQISRIYLAL